RRQQRRRHEVGLLKIIEVGRARPVVPRARITLERSRDVEVEGEGNGAPDLELRPERDVELRLVAADRVVRIRGLSECGDVAAVAERRYLPRGEEAAEYLDAGAETGHRRHFETVVDAIVVP